MGYRLKKTFTMMAHHRLIYLLLFAEIAVAVAMVSYSLNLYGSIRAEERALEAEDQGYVLAITPLDARGQREPAITAADVAALDKLSDGEIHTTIFTRGTYLLDGQPPKTVPILFVDEKAYGLDPSVAYGGSSLMAMMARGVSFISDNLAVKDGHLILGRDGALALPLVPAGEALDAKETTIAAVEETVAFKDALILGFSTYARLPEDAFDETIHGDVRLSPAAAKADPSLIESVPAVLKAAHPGLYDYGFYSPTATFQSHMGYALAQIKGINHMGLMMTASLFAASLSIFRLIFGKREKAMGVFRAVGAPYGAIVGEVAMEAGLLTAVGTVAGWIGGICLTAMFGGAFTGIVTMAPRPMAFAVTGLLMAFMVVMVTVAVYLTIRKKPIVELMGTETL